MLVLGTWYGTSPPPALHCTAGMSMEALLAQPVEEVEHSLVLHFYPQVRRRMRCMRSSRGTIMALAMALAFGARCTLKGHAARWPVRRAPCCGARSWRPQTWTSQATSRRRRRWIRTGCAGCWPRSSPSCAMQHAGPRWWQVGAQGGCSRAERLHGERSALGCSRHA